MRPTIDSVLAPYRPLRPPTSDAGASVFAVLRDGHEDVEVLLIERAIREDDPASGQVGLPGGHVDPVDADLEAAALRELDEEVGLGRSDLVEPVRYVGTFEARRFGLRVGVFAAPLTPISPRRPKAEPREVAGIFWLPLGRLSETVPTVREGSSGPIEVPAVVHEGHALWGFTLRVLTELARGVVAPSTGPS